MTEASTDFAFQLYQAIMREVKVRLRSAEKFVDQARFARNQLGFIELEAGVLQVRFVCELTALALLLAHHDIPGIQRLSREKDPRVLMREIAELKVSRFPMRLESQGPGAWNFMAARMNRETLRRTYGACGDLLHRGSIRRGVEGLRKRLDPEIISGWIGDFRHLLERHLIDFPELERSYAVFLGSDRQEVRMQLWTRRRDEQA